MKRPPPYYLHSGKDVRVVSLKIGKRDIAAHEDSDSLRLTLIAMDSKHVDLSLTANAPSGGPFWLMDETTGVPTEVLPCPSDLIPISTAILLW